MKWKFNSFTDYYTISYYLKIKQLEVNQVDFQHIQEVHVDNNSIRMK